MLDHTKRDEDKSFTEALLQVLGTIDASFVLAWIREYYAPEDIFSNDALEGWAYANLTPLRHMKPTDDE